MNRSQLSIIVALGTTQTLAWASSYYLPAILADPSYRGATMAMHSTVGFSLSALGAWAVGIALDAAGGPQSSAAWMAAFSVLAAGILLGPLALYWSRRETP